MFALLAENVSPLQAVAGGVLIGLGTLIGAIATGVPPGISGVVSATLKGIKGEMAWRLVFLTGLVAGAVIAFASFAPAAAYRPTRSVAVMVVAGVLVGIGTRVSGGCTSGHGVCGIGLGSKRGIVATLIFMATAMGTVFVFDHLLTKAA